MYKQISFLSVKCHLNILRTTVPLVQKLVKLLGTQCVIIFDSTPFTLDPRAWLLVIMYHFIITLFVELSTVGDTKTNKLLMALP